MKTSNLLVSTILVLTAIGCSSAKKDQDPVTPTAQEQKAPEAPKKPETTVPETPRTPEPVAHEEHTQPPAETPVEPKVEPKKEEPVVKEEVPGPKDETPVVVAEAPKAPAHGTNSKCHFVGDPTAENFEIECDQKIESIKFGRMTVGSSLRIHANLNGHDTLLDIERINEHSFKGSIETQGSSSFGLLLEDGSVQHVEYKGNKIKWQH